MPACGGCAQQPMVIIVPCPCAAPQGPPHGRPASAPPQSLPPCIERFDTNRDGKIDPQERKVAGMIIRGEEKQAHRLCEKVKAKEHEWSKRCDASRQASFLQRFDADKDGRLSPEEQLAADAALRAERKELRRHKDALRKQKREVFALARFACRASQAWSDFCKYDANGDGKLDEGERAKQKADEAAAQTLILGKLDIGDDGEVIWAEQTPKQEPKNAAPDSPQPPSAPGE